MTRKERKEYCKDHGLGYGLVREFLMKGNASAAKEAVRDDIIKHRMKIDALERLHKIIDTEGLT